jgi:hypothetical protein
MTAQSSCRYYYSSTTCLFPVPQFSKTHATVPRTSEDSLTAVTDPASLLYLKSVSQTCCRCARFISAGGGVYRFAFDSSSFSFSARRLLASDFFPLRQRGAASTSTAFSRQAPARSFFQGLLSCALPTAFSRPVSARGAASTSALFCRQAGPSTFFQGLLASALPTAFRPALLSEGGAVYCLWPAASSVAVKVFTALEKVARGA